MAGVHRPRLIANYLHKFGWHPIVLTVHPDYYEEPPDNELLLTVSDQIEVLKVKAWKIRRPRLIGDIGLRGFLFLYREAHRLIENRKVDFIWIPIPSFYTALLGRLLHHTTSTPYGIDYIDPWVRDISGRKNWRNKISNLLARMLEPIAIKKSILITGVGEAYYKPALTRNFKANQIISVENISSSKTAKGRIVRHLSFPYGFDPHDHQISIDNIKTPWDKIPHCKPLVYAGAFLPNSHFFVETLFSSISALRSMGKWDASIHLFFLGTGNYVGKSIVGYARDFGIDTHVHEIRDRFPFLHILNFLSRSYSVMVIGSTERHYTASKVYQSILSKRPVLTMLHKESSAMQVLKEVKADSYTVGWDNAQDHRIFKRRTEEVLDALLHQSMDWEPDFNTLEVKYSSRKAAKTFAECLNAIL